MPICDPCIWLVKVEDQEFNLVHDQLEKRNPVAKKKILKDENTRKLGVVAQTNELSTLDYVGFCIKKHNTHTQRR